MFNNFFLSLEHTQIDPFTDWLGLFLIHNGIFAPILLLMLEESGIPLPIPGDFYVIYTGYLISKGAISYLIAFTLTLLSVLLGASLLFYLSSRYGQRFVLKFGKYIHLSEKKLVTVEKKFKKYGIWVIIFGRHIPGFRVPITIFSGMSGIPYKKFILGTFISVIFWIVFYLSVGQHLGIKTFKLLHDNHNYFFILLIPFIIFLGSIVYIKIQDLRIKN